jgi:hypothetical protein
MTHSYLQQRVELHGWRVLAAGGAAAAAVAGVAEDDDLLHDALRLQLLHLRHQRVQRHHRKGLQLAQLPEALGRRRMHVHHSDHPPQRHDGVEGDDELDDVGRADADHGALAHAELAEPHASLPDQRRELAEHDALARLAAEGGQ